MTRTRCGESYGNHRRILIALAVLLCALLPWQPSHAAEQIRSPDGRWTVVISTSPALELRLADRRGQRFLTQSIDLMLPQGPVFEGQKISRIARYRHDGEVIPTAPTKFAVLRDRYSAAVITYKSGFSLEVRAYDDGIAYRFATTTAGPLVIAGERQVNSFAADPLVRAGLEASFYSHTEATYEPRQLSSIKPGTLAALPALATAPRGGPRMLFSETALEAYPGQWFRIGSDGRTLDGAWPPYPLAEKQTSDRDILVSQAADDIARVAGPRTFPWRFVALGETDGELLLNQLSYLLAAPPRVSDVRWIKPGKAQWDWWHDFNLWDAGISGGVSQALYKHYIDFAADNGLAYVILDEGWYKLGDLTSFAGDIDIPELVAYGRQRNVRIILWASWATLRQQFDTVMPLFEKWGIAGLKVDFFQRDDQPAVEFMWKIAKDAAERKLLLDFHGAHKPAGLQRTFPNVLTVEGVKGLEHNKWSKFVTPEHDATIPFIRQVAGPMDYTPGAMDNGMGTEFHVNFRRPMSQGTRAHQLALFVVFESPLQMLADSPSAYRREGTSMAFLRAVPTIWDETRILEAEIGKRIVLARRSGKRWFLAALGGAGGAQTIDLDLGFLHLPEARMRIWRDGPGADRDARDLGYAEGVAVPARLTIDLAPGGGWVAIVEDASVR